MSKDDARVRDIMKTKVITTSPNTTARNAWRLMEKNQIRHLLSKDILFLHATVQADDFPVDP